MMTKLELVYHILIAFELLPHSSSLTLIIIDDGKNARETWSRSIKIQVEARQLRLHHLGVNIIHATAANDNQWLAS